MKKFSAPHDKANTRKKKRYVREMLIFFNFFVPLTIIVMVDCFVPWLVERALSSFSPLYHRALQNTRYSQYCVAWYHGCWHGNCSYCTWYNRRYLVSSFSPCTCRVGLTLGPYQDSTNSYHSMLPHHVFPYWKGLGPRVVVLVPGTRYS